MIYLPRQMEESMIMTGSSLLLKLLFLLHLIEMDHNLPLWLQEVILLSDPVPPRKLQGFLFRNPRATILQDQLEAVQ